ncbi:hypothetical protein LXL04_024347 [Taraxacum kok-saghyz]
MHHFGQLLPNCNYYFVTFTFSLWQEGWQKMSNDVQHIFASTNIINAATLSSSFCEIAFCMKRVVMIETHYIINFYIWMLNQWEKRFFPWRIQVLQRCYYDPVELLIRISNEATMNDQNCFECIDSTFKDIFEQKEVLFGDMTMLLAGYFRQTLPVKTKKKPSQIIASMLPNSYFQENIVSISHCG